MALQSSRGTVNARIAGIVANDAICFTSLNLVHPCFRSRPLRGAAARSLPDEIRRQKLTDKAKTQRARMNSSRARSTANWSRRPSVGREPGKIA
jgi:hypothetical protein